MSLQDLAEELGEPRLPEPLGVERAGDEEVGERVVGAQRDLRTWEKAYDRT